MTLSPIAQCFLIAAQRGRETLARKQELAAAGSTTASAPVNRPTPRKKRSAPRREQKAAADGV